MKIISYDEFVEKYKPIKNDIVPDSSYDRYMFETYGEELDKVIGANPKKVWTLLSCDNEETWICPGYSIVNRMGYFITENAWEDLSIVVNDNEMITVGKAKYLCMEFMENELGIELTDEQKDLLHDFWSHQ